MQKTAVVILNWNGKGFLEKFLPSVLENTPDNIEIWVADNASTDNSVSFLKENFPSVKIVVNKENGGFAKGYNDALKKIKADNYILLNSDVEVTPGWTEAPLQKLLDKKIAACQPKMLTYDNKCFLEHAGASGGYMDKYGFPFCKGRIFNVAEKDCGQYNDDKEVFWATGACLFIKAELYHQVDGFDEDFFAHMEEIDLCWRLKSLGYQIYYCHQSHVYHVGGGTLSIHSPFKLYLNFRNNLFLLVKNYYESPLIFKMLIRMVLDGAAAVKFLTERKPKNFLAVAKAHMHFYSKLPVMLKKRKELKKNSSNPNLTGWYNGSIALDFFLKKKERFTQLNQNDFI